MLLLRAATLWIVGIFLLGQSPAPTDGLEILDNLESLLNLDTSANIFITLSDGPERLLEQLLQQSFINSTARVSAVVTNLKAHAASTQKTIIDMLTKFASVSPTPIKVTSFWITNQIYVEGANKFLVALLKALGPLVSFIEVEKFADLIPIIDVKAGTTLSATTVNSGTWGIQKVEAPAVWAQLQGLTSGPTVVVGSIDSGVRVTHEALKNNYVGQYGWYDPQSETKLPNDQNGHGTHTTGTAVGANGIGVAPQAKWMACKGCQGGTCAQSDLLACGQFMMCPTLPDGSAPNCAKAPAVINNSWGVKGVDNTFGKMIESWHTAGIIPVFAIGNDGPMCRTTGSPGAYANVIAVGATTSDNALARFSSRGPVGGFMGMGGFMKPDLSAPGDEIFSAWNSGDSVYATISGTSMAAPHVTGVVALLHMAKPSITYDEVKQHLLRGCTQDLSRTVLTCEFQFISMTYPNNEYGQGLLNAKNSFASLRGLNARSIG